MTTVIDSNYPSLEQAIQGTLAPATVVETLVLVPVGYVSFDGFLHQGQVVVHREIEKDIEELFAFLLEHRFPVFKAVPIAAYDWSDDASMADNNSSAFNYRVILGTDRLSNHSFGRAIDINPMQNPYFARDGKVHPSGAVYDHKAPGTILPDSEVVRFLKSKGWVWGGDWTVPVDYQHFEKPGAS